MWWAKSAPLAVIRLTELPNSGLAKAHSAHPLAAALNMYFGGNSTTIMIHINVQLGNSEETRILDNQVLA